MNRLKIYLLFSLNLMFIVFTSLWYNNVAVIVLNLFFLVLGTFFCLLHKNIASKKGSLNIFLFFYFLYSLYAVVTDIYYVKNPSLDYFFAFDTLTFYNHSDKYINSDSFLNNIKDLFFDYTSLEWIGFAYFNFFIAYVASFFDEINQLLFKIPIVFFSSYILVLMYQLLNKLKESKNNIRYVFIYGLFSYSLFYSAVFIRDVHIGFFLMLLFYQFYQPFGLKNILVILMLTVLIFFFRFEYGLFALVFLFIYILNKIIANKNYSLLFFSIPLFLIAIAFIGIKFSGEIVESFTVISETTERYEELTVNKASSSSLGSKLMKLPFGIRHLAGGIFSQIYPFPFYTYLQKEGWLTFPFAIAPIFWFIIWFILIKSALFYKINFNFKGTTYVLLGMGILLILGASANVDTRRVMCVYPLLFITVAQYFNSQSKKHIILSAIQGFFCYLILILFYIFIK